MKALLDTCIIMDFLQNREPFAQDAKKIMQAAATELFTGCITAKSATDIYYLTPIQIQAARPLLYTIGKNYTMVKLK